MVMVDFVMSVGMTTTLMMTNDAYDDDNNFDDSRKRW